MSNSKINLDFETLLEDGTNYSTWSVDCTLYLQAHNISYCIQPEFKLENVDREAHKTVDVDIAKTILVLRQHLPPSLKTEFRLTANPSKIWTGVKNRFRHLGLIKGRKASEDWHNLRISNFTTVTAYNIKLREIVAALTECNMEGLCRDSQMIDKTLSTFPSHKDAYASNLSAQNYDSYDELLI
jgi:hypothetical protein